MKKCVVSFLIILIVLTTHGFSFDFSGQLHFDTYAGDPTFGFSFDASGNVLDNLKLNAKLDYFTANSYEAQCLVVGKLWFLKLGAGIAYSIDNSAENIIVPGLGFTAHMDLPFNMALAADAILSLAPANLYEAYSFRVGGAFMFSTANADSTLKYSLKQSAEKKGKTHSATFSIEAFEKGVPFTLSLAFGTDFLTDIEDEDVLFEFHIEGGFSIITKKAGIYSLKGKVTPITYRTNPTPFCVSLGAAFSL